MIAAISARKRQRAGGWETPRPLPEEWPTRDALVVLAALVPTIPTPQRARCAPFRGGHAAREGEGRMSTRRLLDRAGIL